MDIAFLYFFEIFIKIWTCKFDEQNNGQRNKILFKTVTSCGFQLAVHALRLWMRLRPLLRSKKHIPVSAKLFKTHEWSSIGTNL